jgi:hypothetical protein
MVTLGLGGFTTACLVTNPPQFDAPTPTPPFLLAQTAVPDVRTVVTLDRADASDAVFSAEVTSQDDPTPGSGFNRVAVELLVDDGIGDGFGVTGVGTSQSNSLGTDLPVHVTLPGYIWRRLPAGCHRLTLMASHSFADGGPCPAVCGDFSAITWNALVCDSNAIDPALPCDSLDIATCGATVVTCPATPETEGGDAGFLCEPWASALP